MLSSWLVLLVCAKVRSWVGCTVAERTGTVHLRDSIICPPSSTMDCNLHGSMEQRRTCFFVTGLNLLWHGLALTLLLAK